MIFLATKNGNKNFPPPLLVLSLDPGSGIRDPGSGMDKNQDPGSGRNIQDPQDCIQQVSATLYNSRQECRTPGQKQRIQAMPPTFLYSRRTHLKWRHAHFGTQSFFLETLSALEQENCASVPYNTASKYWPNAKISVVTMPIRFWLFYFDADPDPDRILLEVLYMLENQIIFFTLIHRHDSLNCFIFLVSVIGDIICGILVSLVIFSGKKYSLSLHIVEMDTHPDPEKLNGSDRNRIHSTNKE